MSTGNEKAGAVEPIVSATPRTTALHCSLPMKGAFGVADAYNSMRRHAEALELELSIANKFLLEITHIAAFNKTELHMQKPGRQSSV